jgi:hypothetical protein
VVVKRDRGEHTVSMPLRNMSSSPVSSPILTHHVSVLMFR